MDIRKKLEILRHEMQQKKIDIYIVPSIDAHNSEYVPECFERRSFISGFDGSAGEALITMEHAYISTDGRYFLQAIKQLDSNYYSLIKQEGFTSEIETWLLNNAQGKTVGVDPSVVSISRGDRLHDVMDDIGGRLEFITDNLVDNCKHALGEEISMPNEALYALDDKYSGKSVKEKLNFMRGELAKHDADYIALNVLDEIAWVFNIRGSDSAYNPLVISYAIIGKNDACIFVNENKVPHTLKDNLQKLGVAIFEYSSFGDYLSKLLGCIALDDKTANCLMLDSINPDTEVVFMRSPIVMAKACKNNVEIEGAKEAHIKDAVAVISFLNWLDNNWHNGITELSCIDRLAQFRANGANLMGVSFATISGFASNGAIIHYRADSNTNRTVDDSSLYLIDSGGQYLDGTTDITRTVHLGEPSTMQKRHYTLVLKGHLALGRAVFPHGTCGEHLDVLARSSLWQEYLNYRHGTGHGVGSFLCVHEGPQKISTAISGVPLLPGMIVSNEPGLYIENQYGIRIENLCFVNKIMCDEALNSEYGAFYRFEDLTLVPYCKKLIDKNLLNQEEINQIKTYYNKIVSKVRPYLGEIECKWFDAEIDIFN